MKKEFIRRLVRLEKAIFKAVGNNSSEGDLFPALFSVYSYLWCNNPNLKSK